MATWPGGAVLLATVVLAACAGGAGSRGTPSPSPARSSPLETASPSLETAASPRAPDPTPRPVVGPAPTGLIEGVAEAGPTCPVERVGAPPCVAPVAIPITVTDRLGRQVAALTSGADGSFRVAVPPGAYTVTGTLTRLRLPATRSVPVTVVAGATAPVTLRFDTGIR